MYPDPRPAPRSNGLGQIVLAILALAGIAFGAYLIFGRQPGNAPLNDPDAKPRAVAPPSNPDADERSRIDLFKNTRPSVVNVDTLVLAQNASDQSIIERQQGTGSGFVWDDRGHVVTNFHVIQGAVQQAARNRNATLRVTFFDRESFNARVVGAAPDFDLAVLKIDGPPSRFKPIPVGTSADLEVGQTAYAIGNPYGQTLSLTQGIISALDREIQSLTDRPIKGAIQTDAAINPGNSGGPLLDRAGRLIGVNTSIYSPTGSSIGIGFSIPVDTVNEVVPELIRTGRVGRPTLGIVAVKETVTRDLGIERGVLLAEARPNGPAARAGLRGTRIDRRLGERQLGDVIVSIGGQEVNNLEDLGQAMKGKKPGDEVEVRYLRDGEERSAKLTLEGN